MPIIILTAYDWSDIEEEAKAAGVTAFCAKPLFMSDLKAALLAANNLIETENEIAAWTLRILLAVSTPLVSGICQSIIYV